MRLPLITLAALLLSSCAVQTAQPIATSSSPSVTPSEMSCWISPLTGTCSNENNPVLIVKIDDVAGARPQRGLNSADVVIVEPVEGGLTRLMAVFQSDDPIEVGPVRSARITDIDLAPAFGVPGFAYSGATTKLRPLLADAQIQEVGAPQGQYGFFRVETQNPPHNLIANTSALFSRIENAIAARLVSASAWAISSTPSNGVATHSMTMQWPASEKSFVWDPLTDQWLIKVYDEPLQSMRCCAASLERATATTVFVMQTVLQDNPIKFKRGAVTPYPKTLGEGVGWVLTNGERVEATWKRPTAQDLPRWFRADGSEISILPGRIWWLIQTDRDDIVFQDTAPVPGANSSSASAAS